MSPRLLLASLALTCLVLPLHASANVSLPALFSDHMVLQAGTVANIWGWASPSEKISVTWGGQTQDTTADSQGKWRVPLRDLPAGQTGRLAIQGDNICVIEDVVVGEVWLCAGQSNMAFGVGGQENQPLPLPQLRVFTEESKAEGTPQQKCAGRWVRCSPDTIKQFSGTAYFFGKNLHSQLRRPIGLIVSAVGGTRIESWTSAEIQRQLPELEPQFAALEEKLSRYDPIAAKAAKEKQLAAFQELVEKAKAAGLRPPKPPSPQYDPRANGPGNLFNAKIAPLIPYSIRGAIWYQGEANAQSVEEGSLYARQLPLLIKDWRTRWGQGEFPFAWVQLPKFNDPKFPGWCEVRESMRQTLEVPHTGMAVTVDTGDPDKIHPNNKRETGRRLSLWALAKVYNQDLSHSGPLFLRCIVRASEVEVHFGHADGGLVTPHEEPLRGFEVSGEDGVWHAADSRICGGTVVASSSMVPAPRSIRYAWANAPDCNLFNNAGLPASPFRSPCGPLAPSK